MTHYNYNFAIRLFIQKTGPMVGFSTYTASRLYEQRLKSKDQKLTFMTNPIILIKKESEKVPLQTYHSLLLDAMRTANTCNNNDELIGFQPY